MRSALRMPEEQINSSVSTSGLSARLRGTGLIAAIAVVAATLAFTTWLYVNYEVSALAFAVGALLATLGNLCLTMARRSSS